MSMNIGSKLIHQLGSTNSLIPLATKEVFDSAGQTYFSHKAGGKIEAKDRLVDEVGTGALWLFGIPTFKKFIDKTIFKKAGISPEIDTRLIKNNKLLQKAIENAPTEEIANELKKAGENISKVKNLNYLKFGLSVGLTLTSYFGLTKFKQNMTKKNIEREFLQKQMQKTPPCYETNPIFDEIQLNKKKKSNPSFGSSAVMKIAENIMLDPIKNMMVLDGCISAERLSHSRTKGEFAESTIKEGSFLFFIYGAGEAIKKVIEAGAKKFFNAPINLDAKFLSSDLAEKVLTDKNIQKDVQEFVQKFGKNINTEELYEFILKNQNHTVVNAAKKSGIISTAKNGKVDTRKFINEKELQKLSNDLISFINSSKNSKNIENYLKKVKSFKVISTILNIGVCCLSLGYIVPKAMYAYRIKHQDGKTDFHVKTEYEKELAKKFLS